MKAFLITMTVVSGWWILGCNPAQDQAKKSYDLASLEILPHPDTLFINVNETRTVALRGTSVNISDRTMSNTGIMTDVSYTVRSADTVTQVVQSGDATWFSSNTSVATASQGLITARSPGFATITAAVGTVQANALLVSVKAVNTAPGLLLNPPQYSVIFQNSTVVSGNVQLPALLRITEASSAHNNANVAINAGGNFAEQVSGLAVGLRTITAIARNVNDTTLSTTRQKFVYYCQYLSPEADSICGAWTGTTLGRNFFFRISKSIVLSRYDITGHIDIQFEGLGVVRDIDLVGIVNRDGTMDATLTKSYEGFTISGNLSGYFKTVGSGEGSYGTTAKKSGWPTLSGSADWTAVKSGP